MKLIDTHTHICDSVFDDDRTSVLERARESGVGGVVSIGEDLSDARKNLMLADEHPMLLPGAGLYPTVLDLDEAERICEFIRTESPRLVCIGEVGLDFWKVKEEEDQELQREIFRGFIKLSNELDLPLNVHSRSAGRHAIAMLVEEGGRRVQLHAFDGKASTALPAVEAGFYFSIPPSIARSRQKQKLVRRLPIECLLVETDSPVLGPQAGQRNEPANVRISLEAIAEIKEIPLKAAVETIVENTERLYGRC
jgi:TatD DNase family protein